eukprot:scaffold102938_cov24-Cyclotella_meneghiniana.AAC.1
METWFKSERCLERKKSLKITANKYSGTTVSRISITIEVGNTSAPQSEMEAHHGLRLTSTKDDQIDNEQMKLPPRPIGYGIGWNSQPPFPTPYYSQVGMPQLASINTQSKSSTEEITVSTLSGTIGRTELMLLMNSISDQIKTIIETSFAVIQPQSRLVQCLNERDKRLEEKLQCMIDNKIAEIVAVSKHTPKTMTIDDTKDDEDIPRELRNIADETLNLMEDAQKALNFDKYATQGISNGNDDIQLSPATAALKARMANTPLKQSWEEAAETDANALTTDEAATTQSNENEQTLINESIPEESKSPENTGTKEQEDITTTTENDNNQENPTSKTNTSHYTLGFEGDESSTN